METQPPFFSVFWLKKLPFGSTWKTYRRKTTLPKDVKLSATSAPTESHALSPHVYVHRSQSQGAGVHNEVAVRPSGRVSGQLMQRRMAGSVGQVTCVFHSGHSQQLGLGVTCTTTGAAKQQRPTSWMRRDGGMFIKLF